MFGLYEISLELENEYGMTGYTLEVHIIEQYTKNEPPYFDEVEWDEVSVISVI